jgi:N-succinyldiaminopimelate aminotransferase
MPPATQVASAAAWDEERHVEANRDQYRAKFDAVTELLSDTLRPQRPDAGFYLWAKTPVADTDFARDLFQQQHITVLPGQYLSRECQGINPGSGYVRMALVAPVDECIDAGQRIQQFMGELG